MTEIQTRLPPINVDYSSLETKYKIYKRRWFILFIFSINSLANAVLFASISAINDVASSYWNVRPDVIDWLPNSFVLIYIFIALPSAYFMSSFGLRVSMVAGSSLNALSAALHFAGYQRTGFPFVMAGQIAAALSVGAILQIPARLSTVWFPEHEHARATSISILSNIFGVALGFLQPTQMVPSIQPTQMVPNLEPTQMVPISGSLKGVNGGMFRMFLSQLIFLIICLLLVYIFFEEKPPSPPSYAAALTEKKNTNNQVSFIGSLKILGSDKNFNLLAHGYGLYFGMYIFFCVVLNEMVKSKVKETNIGWMGFACDCFGILGVIICAEIIDKYQCYKLVSVVLSFGALVSWIIFTFILIHTESQYGLFIAYSFVGLFGIPYFAVGVEQAAEMTYPIPEGTSSAIILMFGNLYGFILVLFLGAWIDKGRLPLVCYVTIGVYAMTFFFTCITRMTLKRQATEINHKIVVNTEQDDDDDNDDDDENSDSEYFPRNGNGAENVKEM